MFHAGGSDYMARIASRDLRQEVWTGTRRCFCPGRVLRGWWDTRIEAFIDNQQCTGKCDLDGCCVSIEDEVAPLDCTLLA